MIDNPAYKGAWKPKMIPNPEYKGEWIHPEIPNPDYHDDPELAVRCTGCSHIGFELWQVKSGTVFDDILVTDSLAEAQEYAKATFVKNKEAEKAAFDAHEKAKSTAATPSKTEDDEDEDEDHDEL